MTADVAMKILVRALRIAADSIEADCASAVVSSPRQRQRHVPTGPDDDLAEQRARAALDRCKPKVA